MLFHAILTRLIRRGALTVRYPDGAVRRYGGTRPGPEAAMEVRTPRALRRMTLHPSLGFGEAYMDGDLAPLGCSIHEVFEVLVVNHVDEEGGHPFERAMEWWRWAKRRLDQLNHAARARRNVAHHYDLNGRLYALFLDRDRHYSCAYFPTGQETLEEAQAAKVRHIAAKLRLDRPRGAAPLEVLDIGSGWGGLAIALARDRGARVTGITLSTEQLEAARQRAAEAGLADRVRFELLDYRALGTFLERPVDRIVSVGMFEHVGLGHYRDFFGTLRRALHPEGVALVHSIGRMDGPGSTNSWIARYIFPGAYTPALSEVFPAVERAGLWATDVEVLRLHYAWTLAHWRRRFAANRDAIASLYDERFCRMFEFYLSLCELAFRHVGHMVWQMQLTRAIDAVPPTRDYMVEAERAASGAAEARPRARA